MWTHLLNLIRESLGGTSLPSQSEESREFFQARLKFYGKLGTIVIFAALAYRVLTAFFIRGSRFVDICSNPTNLGHFVGVLANLGVWQWCARQRLSASRLRLLDAGLAIGLCALTGFSFWIVEPLDTMPDKALLAATDVLVFRSIFLPSTAAWTLILGLLSSLPVVIFGALTLQRWPAGFPGYDPAVEIAMFVQWMLIAVSVSTVTSAIIYRLRRNVHEARKLGQYTLEEKLGEGGMGVVYRARHALLRRPTAVKLLRSESATDASIARFEREVQITSRLTHPNTIAIYDYGRTPDGIFYYAMEYLEGLDLDRLVRSNGPLPPGRAIHILKQVASSLTEAHEAGLIHRDIKPANVILCERGGFLDVVKVLDFGLVKSVDGGESSVSGVHTITGTPHYMSPESLRDPLAVDGRSDLYAVGAMAYFLVSGRPPFLSGSVFEVFQQHLNASPEPPSKPRGQPLPADLEALILRCLEKDAGARPSSARELLSLLESLADASRWSQKEARAWWLEHGARAREAAAAASTADFLPRSPAALKTITATADGR